MNKLTRIAIAAAAGAIALAPTAAFAAGYDGDGISTSVTTAAPGESFSVTVSGFKPNSTVSFKVNGEVMKTATADASGSVTVTLSLPASAAAGEYTLSAVGVDAAGAAYTVSAPMTVADATDGELPDTGSNPLPTILTISLVAGAGIVLVRRRRA